jgi:hypothetical protein
MEAFSGRPRGRPHRGRAALDKIDLEMQHSARSLAERHWRAGHAQPADARVPQHRHTRALGRVGEFESPYDQSRGRPDLTRIQGMVCTSERRLRSKRRQGYVSSFSKHRAVSSPTHLPNGGIGTNPAAV